MTAEQWRAKKRIRGTQMRKLREQGWTLQEIGEGYGISRQRVHQILQWLDRLEGRA